jgi:hypothetical protein
MDNLGIMIFAIGGGLFSIAGAVFDWDWFMNNGKARFFVNLFGRDAARIFYGMLGLFLIGLGVLALYAS